ncbi:MAG: adenylyl-sulfate kinase, partial [Promethearchaeota archaeon]
MWFTGLPCSGKSVLADSVAQNLRERGMKVERLDGDIVRKSLTRDLGFSEEDR